MIARKAQSIFEYIILTSVVAALILVFVSSKYFIGAEDPKTRGIKEVFNDAFESSYTKIVE